MKILQNVVVFKTTFWLAIVPTFSVLINSKFFIPITVILLYKLLKPYALKNLIPTLIVVFAIMVVPIFETLFVGLFSIFVLFCIASFICVIYVLRHSFARCIIALSVLWQRYSIKYCVKFCALVLRIYIHFFCYCLYPWKCYFVNNETCRKNMFGLIIFLFLWFNRSFSLPQTHW